MNCHWAAVSSKILNVMRVLPASNIAERIWFNDKNELWIIVCILFYKWKDRERERDTVDIPE